ncbi:thioredoxin reductase (NADPH) [Desulfitobacterium sp. LBE]|uniref:FAD/NAD(P)-binding domain-containing protein n=5 Tax=root TaxID=1 RepID=Q24XU4_DESHY|nr:MULTISPECIES: FAD-dependent oxidoreductase [Desulfitobacterium]ACL20503.1 Thioredoxin-disulfide reductase [Desulfitobacterium hafniense DCB-2]EHL04450.1 pyridine nucleotide-disulfide oxidoreductase [Desulfitobacterium hafniense DP7]KTE92395.1 thioredoxin reductase [Desulfitobacterium hafniense]MEA5024534.1 FAD-dependent oxidoreductase [Desulfitobacterium hafniense]TWH56666.1 thioredoxin reductase (NADPH) [Desulfitobacterium sp. LBE]
MSEGFQLKSRYQLAIVGCGPAGMSAALNAKIRNKDFILLGSDFCSPKLAKAPQIDNYLGFHEIKGEDLRQNFLNHVKAMGIEVVPWKVLNIYPGPPFTLVGNNESFEADAVILATGVSPTKLLPGETELLGRGVGYCATCDGPLYKGKKVAIVSYSHEGEAEANFMAEICAEVYYLPFYKEVGQLDSRIIQKKARVKEISGTQKVEKLVLDNEEISVDGVFVLRESLPAEQIVPGLEMDKGAIKVNRELETGIPGLFAAGDCSGQPYQLNKAVGEGGTAALSAIKYLDEMKKG